MKEKDKRPVLQFGQPLWKNDVPGGFFPNGEDLPLFSGTPQQAIETPFVPEDKSLKQTMFPGMPGIDYDVVRAKDRQRQQRRKKTTSLPPKAAIFFGDE